VTLVVAIRCTDGVAIAADSASTDADIKTPVEKITRLSGAPVLYGHAGDAGLMQKIDEALKSVQVRNTLKRTRQEIKKAIAPELAESAQYHVPYPEMFRNQVPQAVVLFAGVLDGEPWILEIEKDNTDTIYGDELGNFAAIGSGKSLAHALFRSHLNTERDLELGKHFAYRILDDEIQLSSMYLAHPVVMYTVAVDGTIQKIDQAERVAIENVCEGWRQLERDVVQEMQIGQTGQEGAEVPKP
jgi:proteasome beta subunit